jgi:hypothetical protein
LSFKFLILVTDEDHNSKHIGAIVLFVPSCLVYDNPFQNSLSITKKKDLNISFIYLLESVAYTFVFN